MTNRHKEEILEELRELWEADGDLRTLWQALGWARRSAMPDWLIDALKQNLDATIVKPVERQRRVQQQQSWRIVNAVRGAIYGETPYPVYYATDIEAASEDHFRLAAERLNAEGLACTPDGVKKTWQRYKPLPYEQAIERIMEDPDQG